MNSEKVTAGALAIGVLVFISKEIYSFLRDDYKRMRDEMKALVVSMAETKVAVNALRDDLRFLLRIKGDVDALWKAFRKFELSKNDSTSLGKDS